MMKLIYVFVLCLAVFGFWTRPLHGTEPPACRRHVIVYGEDGKFGGWPANHGIWSWGDEILVGFSIGDHKDLGERHNIDRERPEHHVLARSKDGGLTWQLEEPAQRGMLINAGGMRHGTTDPQHREAEPIPLNEPINFMHPDFCMTTRFQHVDGGESRLYYSYDRGHTWRGPFRLPMFGQRGVMARTDYLVDGRAECTIMLTASKQDEEEGRVFCGRTRDGGLSWKFISYVGPEPKGFSIMPSTVRISPKHLVTTTRRREGDGELKRRWIDTWMSQDNGLSWTFLNDAVDDVGEGNPPDLIGLRDGRLCLVYGDRQPPFQIIAKLSDDHGRTWSKPIAVSKQGGGRDMGYVRSVQRMDGRIVSVYYFQPTDSDFRQILATIWEPAIRR